MDAPQPGAHPVAVRLLLPDHAATSALGAALGATGFEGAVLLLDGELGAGKTTLAQGLARALGVEGPVPSPTFVLIAEYPDARIPLRHADLYRVGSLDEARALGVEERVGEEGIWVIEWAGRFPELWPTDRLELRLGLDGEGRVAALRPTGPRHARWVEALRAG